MNRFPDRVRIRHGRDAAERLLPRILALVNAEGILPLLRDRSPVSREEIIGLIETNLGYALGAGNRRRMVGVLLDLLVETGWLQEEGPDGSRLVAKEPGGSAPFRMQIPGTDDSGPVDGEVDFFTRCVELAPSYLRGGAPVISFQAGHQELWDRFLGCQTFRNYRDLVLELLVSREAPGFHLLDLCHGPGWGVVAAIGKFPTIRITAIDYTDAFSCIAKERVRAQLSENERNGHPAAEICWVGPDRWKGFGDHPLPFGDGHFHGVLFSGGDPYIPRALRTGVYRDIHRVLAPKGKLGILTRGYPDRKRVHVPSFRMRIASLVHDFAESVCEGWEGFPDVEESRSLFREIGFETSAPLRDRMNAFESSIWILKKRGFGD